MQELLYVVNVGEYAPDYKIKTVEVVKKTDKLLTLSKQAFEQGIYRTTIKPCELDTFNNKNYIFSTNLQVIKKLRYAYIQAKIQYESKVILESQKRISTYQSLLEKFFN